MKTFLTALFAACAAASSAQAYHVPTAKEIADFQDVTPKAALSPPGVYVCWGDNKIILTKPHWGYAEEACAAKYSAIAAKLKARRAELIAAPAQQGCIGKDWLTCVATISVRNQVTTGILMNDLLEPTDEHDLDGKVLPQWVRIDVFPTFNPALPKTKVAQRADHFTLDLDDQDRVKSVEVRLVTYPGQAETQEDWDATGVYELARGVVGECIGDRLSFYKSYQGLMKGQSLSSYDTDTSYGTTGKASGAVCEYHFEVSSGGSTDIKYGVHYSEGFTIAPKS